MTNQTDLYLGVALEASQCVAVVGTKQGEMIDRIAWPAEVQRGADSIIADVIEYVWQLMEKHKQVKSVGVSITGPLDAKNGIIYNPPTLPCWNEVHLKDKLQAVICVPVNIEHDATAGALAEYWWGVGKNVSRIAYLSCYSKFSIGLLFDGKPYYGAKGHNVEVGHIRYLPDGPLAMGKQGSYAAFCCGEILHRLAAWKFPERWGTHPPDREMLSDLAASGDSDAYEVINVNARAMGDVCALITDLLFVDLIILETSTRYFGDEWLKKVQMQMYIEATQASGQNCQIKPDELGEKMPDLAALAAAVNAIPN